MGNWIEQITIAIVAIFAFFTARVTLSTKKVETTANLSKQSFDIIIERLEAAEVELKSLRRIQSKYETLSERYERLKTDYAELKEENSDLKNRVTILETKEKLT